MTDIPGLLFSRPGLSTAVQCRNGQVSLNNEVFEIVKVEVVAKLLADHGIPAVLLSACLSSWAQGKPLANMCRVFASHGIRIVTGISFTAVSSQDSLRSPEEGKTHCRFWERPCQLTVGGIVVR